MTMDNAVYIAKSYKAVYGGVARYQGYLDQPRPMKLAVTHLRQ
jgi:hypothetical protein